MPHLGSNADRQGLGMRFAPSSGCNRDRRLRFSRINTSECHDPDAPRSRTGRSSLDPSRFVCCGELPAKWILCGRDDVLPQGDAGAAAAGVAATAGRITSLSRANPLSCPRLFVRTVLSGEDKLPRERAVCSPQWSSVCRSVRSCYDGSARSQPRAERRPLSSGCGEEDGAPEFGPLPLCLLGMVRILLP